MTRNTRPLPGRQAAAVSGARMRENRRLWGAKRSINRKSVAFAVFRHIRSAPRLRGSMVRIDFNRLRFLVIDDNAHMRRILRTLLHGFGAREVFEAEDGASGLE